jgi:hypothetical protein
MEGQQMSHSQQFAALAGAEGFGAGAKGGTGGRTIEVTHLGDHGPGSLRAAIEASGPRIVVFRVAGTIALETALEIVDPWITIAGQTAPGGGVCIRNRQLGIATEHVIVQHLRLRPGYDPDDLVEGGAFALYIKPGSRHVMIDHCSMSWGYDKTLVLYSPGWTDVTVQWCIISEGLRCQMGSLARGDAEARCSFHHNLYAHNKERNPLPCSCPKPGEIPEGLTFDFRNNVIYDWGSTHAGYNSDSEFGMPGVTKMNFVNNYYKAGPSTPGSYAFIERTPHNRAYHSGNCMNGREPADPWDLVQFVYYENDRTRIRDFTPQEKAAYRQAAPFAVAPVATDDAGTAYYRVLSEAGATLPRRDAVDTRLFHETINGWGRLIQSQQEVGGWPDLS